MEKKLYFAPETVVTDINMEEIMQQVSAGEIPVDPNPEGNDDDDATAKSAFSVWDE